MDTATENLEAENARLKAELDAAIDKLAEQKAEAMVANRPKPSRPAPRSHPYSLHRLAEVDREAGFVAAFWPFMIVPGLMLFAFLFVFISYHAY